MKQGGIEIKEDRILVFEPWAIGLYGVNLMLDGELLPAGTILDLLGGREVLGYRRDTIQNPRIIGWITIEPMSGSLRGCFGFRTVYLIARPSLPPDLRFRIVFPNGRCVEDTRPLPEIIWASDPNRTDPFGRIPLIEVKHFTCKPSRL